MNEKKGSRKSHKATVTLCVNTMWSWSRTRNWYQMNAEFYECCTSLLLHLPYLWMEKCWLWAFNHESEFEGSEWLAVSCTKGASEAGKRRVKISQSANQNERESLCPYLLLENDSTTTSSRITCLLRVERGMLLPLKNGWWSVVRMIGTQSHIYWKEGKPDIWRWIGKMCCTIRSDSSLAFFCRMMISLSLHSSDLLFSSQNRSTLFFDSFR